MPIARTQWLLRLMVLVMAFTGSLQAYASSLQGNMSMCPGANSEHMGQATGSHAHHMSADDADQCRHMDGDRVTQASDRHDHCGSSCMGNCGACAHCPAGIVQFSSTLETPPQFLIPAVEHRPGDVPPETNLRPPRLFS